jgi:hypothetical protein
VHYDGLSRQQGLAFHGAMASAYFHAAVKSDFRMPLTDIDKAKAANADGLPAADAGGSGPAPHTDVRRVVMRTHLR